MGRRVLEVQLVGDSRDLDRALRRAGQSSSTFGSRLRSVGRYATLAGAALGAAFVYQTKRAIEEVEDLSKTTLGLNRNLGLNIETASRWGAVAKSRDIDARSLTMSFTTLSRKMVDAAEGGETSLKVFKSLGITQEQVKRGTKDFDYMIGLLADRFGDAEGGARRQAAAQQLLGRGYATVLPLFASGAAGLKEQQRWADRYGATLDGKTLGSMEKLISAQRESKVAWLGLQVSIARHAAPALTEAHRRFQDLVAIINDPKLTREQKIEKIAKKFRAIADEAGDAFAEILPEMANQAGRQAPKVAGAFVDGFLEADAWGKLAIAAFLLSKFGGWGALFGLGKKIGGRIGAGMAASGALSTLPWMGGPGGGPRRTRTPGPVAQAPYGGPQRGGTGGGGWGRRLGSGALGTLGGPVGAVAAIGLSEAIATSGDDGIAQMDKFERHYEDTVDQIISQRSKLTKNQRRQASEWIASLARERKVSAQWAIEHIRDLNRAGNAGDGFTKKQRRMFRGLREEINNAFKTGKPSRNLDRLLDKWGLSFKELQKISGGSASRIARIITTLTSALGASGVNAGSIRNAITTTRTIANSFGWAAGGRLAGYSQRDNRWILARDGEAILTPEVHQPAVDAAFAWSRRTGGPVPYGSLAEMFWRTGANMGTTTHAYAKGGVASGTPQIRASASGPPGAMTGVISGGNVVMVDAANAWLKKNLGGDLTRVGNIVQLGLMLQRMGYQVGEHPRFGGVAPVHTAGSYHYRGRAIDVNHGGDEMAALDRIAGPLRRNPAVVELLWRVADHYDHLHVAMAAGGIIGDFGRAIRANRAPYPAALALMMAGYAESGMRDLGYGDSTSEGALQLLAETASAMGLDPHDEFAVANAFLTRGYWGRGSAIGLARRGVSPATIAHLVQGNATGTGVYSAQAGRARAALRAADLVFDERGQLVGAYGMLERHKGPFKSQRDAVSYLMRLGFSKDEAQRAAINYVRRHPKQGGKAGGRGGRGKPDTGRTGGGGGGGGTGVLAGGGDAGASLGVGGLAGPGMGYEDQVAMLDIAGAIAEGTTDTADDFDVIRARISLYSRRDREVVDRIRALNRRISRRDLGDPPKRRKGESDKAYRKRLREWQRERMRTLREDRSEALGEHGSLISDVNALREELSGGGAEGGGGGADMTQLLTEIRDELKAQRLREEQTGAVAKSEITRALADLLSGELGWMSDRRVSTAGSGSVSRF